MSVVYLTGVLHDLAAQHEQRCRVLMSYSSDDECGQAAVAKTSSGTPVCSSCARQLSTEGVDVIWPVEGAE